MSNEKNSLYRWDRFAKPKERVYSRSQRVSSDDDIQNWIKKVETASEHAAAEVFSSDVSQPRGRHAGRAAALATIENLHQHESAYEEAHDLLQQWMQDATLDHILEEPHQDEPTLPCSKTSAEVKWEWDHLVQQNEDQYGIHLNLDLEELDRKKKDVFSIYETDSDVVVGDILQKLRAKPLVPATFMEDLGLEPRKVSPVTKMQLRHQQVKENRERRMQQLEKKHREKQAKKEAVFQARQLLRKEEDAKMRKQRDEETEIELHMAVIRREMEKQLKKKTTAKNEEFQLTGSASLTEVQHQSPRESVFTLECQAQFQEETRRRKVELRLRELEARRATDNMKLLHHCFSSWYQHVIERRLQMGKAAAMCDWKLTLRHWNAWRSYTQSRQLDRHAKSHHQNILDMHRKERAASRHYHNVLLRKCMLAWQVYVDQCQQSEAIQQSQHATRSKMDAFLQAAQQGRLWSDGKEDADLRRSQSLSDIQNQSRIEEIFGSKSQGVKPAGGSQSARSKGSRSGSRPKAAWQLTRDDALTKQERAQLSQRGDGCDGAMSGPTSGRSLAGSSKQPWGKTPFMPDTYQHRHQAQQRLLDQQQKQLREQQRLLQELQYLQRQQLLQQTLSQQQQVTQVSGRGNDQSAKLQQHLQALKKELLAAGMDPERVKAGIAETGPPDSEDPNIHASVGEPPVDEGVAADTTRTQSSTRAASSARPIDTERSAASDNSTSRTNIRHTKFLHDMEARAAERAKLKKERDDKRRKAEEEKLAALEAEKEERLSQEKAAKEARVEAYREKKRLEKQRESERQQQVDHQRHQMAIADEHHLQACMRYRGWVPWQRLIIMAKMLDEKARSHYRRTLLGKCLSSWHESVRQEVAQKEALADDHCSFLLLRRCFMNWRKAGECVAIQEEKAQRFYERRLKQRFVRAWAEYTEDEKMAMWRKERQAREHNLRRIQKRYFHVLRFFPEIIRRKKEKESRREQLRKKVASMLPDFEGVPDKKVNVSESFDFG